MLEEGVLLRVEAVLHVEIERRVHRSGDDWTIVAIHESKESWEAFRDGTLMPRMQAGIEGGFTMQPQETSFEVHNEVKA